MIRDELSEVLNELVITEYLLMKPRIFHEVLDVS